jgi:GNAT superfamily N-acetyltransferase
VGEIRRAREGDFGRLQEIERAAGQVFVGVGLERIAADDPFTVDELRAFLDHDALWVYGDPAAAYVATEVVDGCLHVEQVSVHPDHAHRGIGRELIDFVSRRAGTAVTLTTFVDVPWNGPYYERLGFRTLADDELTDGLREIRAKETAIGLDIRPRVAMRRPAIQSKPTTAA